jgi:hypothetical protein
MATSASSSAFVDNFDPSIPKRIIGELPSALGPGMITTFVTPEIENQIKGDPHLLTLEEGTKALYLCEPRDELFPLIYSRRGIFTDPAGHLEAKWGKGGDATKNDGPFLAFKGLAQLFRPTSIEKWHVISADPIKIQVEMHYQVRGSPSLSPSIPFKTLLTLNLEGPDAEPQDKGKIRHLTDEWSGSPLQWEKDGFLGKLAEWRRNATGFSQKAFVSLTGGASVQGSGLTDPKIAEAVLGSKTGQPSQTK